MAIHCCRSERTNRALHQTSDRKEPNPEAGLLAHTSVGPEEAQGDTGQA